MRLISTRTHGILDYVTVGTVFALPRMLGWSDRVTRMMTGAAAATLGYSLLTRYELGLIKLLPMRAHLTMDFAGGALMCAAPLLMPDEDDEVKRALVGIGLFEIAASLTTRTEPEPSIPARGRELDEAKVSGAVRGSTEGMRSRLIGA